MRRDLALCLRLLPPAIRWRWFVLVPLAVLAALAEAFGAAAVFGLLTIVMDPARTATLPVASSIHRWLGAPGSREMLVSLTLLLMAFYLVRNALLAFASYVHEQVTESSVVDVSSRLLLGYFTVPWAFHFRRNSAGLIQRVSDSVEISYSLVLSSFVHVITEALIAAALVAVLALTAPLATLVAVAATGLLILVPSRLAGPIFNRLGREDQQSEEQRLQTLQQSLGAMKELKIAARERFFHAQFAAVARRLAAVRRRRTTLLDAIRLAIETVFVLALLLVVLILTMTGRTGPDIVSLLGLYGYAGFRLVPAANRISRHVGQIKVGRSYLHDVADDFETIAALRAAAPADGGADDAPPFADRIRLEHVSYAYDADAADVLRDVSLAIRRGESVGIVGQTGAGKSTLVDLLLGLLQPAAGRVTVDGRDLAGHARWWQRQVGYVPQTFALFDDTLRRNIAFGVADAEIDETRLARAVAAAQLDDVVAGLPDRLGTLVGERGIRLSGGQRQRVVIARALYRGPQVLVFDEATSSLDNQTEREITRAIDALHGTVTVVVIAHRLSTVRGCDRLIFLHQGRVAAIGTFDELMAGNAAFRAMAATE